jgi:hypothetical protein
MLPVPDKFLQKYFMEKLVRMRGKSIALAGIRHHV